MDYQSNSHKSRATDKKDETERKPKEKVITGEVVKRKKTLGSKIKESFTGDDAQSVGDYLVFDVIIPAAKTTISDVVSQGIERMLFGEVRSRGAGYSTRTRASHTSYNSMYRPNDDSQQGARRDISQRGRATHQFDEIILADRGEAEQILDLLNNLIAQYDVATVADLYDMVGITGNFVDNKWGWTNLNDASADRVRQGYLLNLPKPLPLD